MSYAYNPYLHVHLKQILWCKIMAEREKKVRALVGLEECLSSPERMKALITGVFVWPQGVC